MLQFTTFPVTFGWEEVLCLENKKTQRSFNLAAKLSFSWQKIGQTLGIEQEDMKAANSEFEDDNLIKWVLGRWFRQPDNLVNKDLYPLSWEGLRKLLVDSGLQKTADKYFTFLDGLDAQ